MRWLRGAGGGGGGGAVGGGGRMLADSGSKSSGVGLVTRNSCLFFSAERFTPCESLSEKEYKICAVICIYSAHT
jgi:hypothetical protein